MLRRATRPGESRLEPIAERETGADGLVDFGPLRPEDYVLNVYAPRGEYHQRSIDHRPGDARIERIICPTAPATAEEAEINVSVDWPNDLRQRDLALICRLTRPYLTRTVAANRWTSSTADSLPRADFGAHWLVLESNGETRVLVAESKRDSRGFPTYYPFQLKTDGPTGDHGFRVDPNASHFYFGMENALPTSPSVRWPTGTYHLTASAVGAPPKEPPEDAVRRLDVVALSWTQLAPINKRRICTVEHRASQTAAAPGDGQPITIRSRGRRA